MAAQPGVGLLSDRRPGDSASDRAGTPVAWPNLNDAVAHARQGHSVSMIKRKSKCRARRAGELPPVTNRGARR
jgi:hypothetical protein